MPYKSIEPHPNELRAHLFKIIFLADTKSGKIFDILLLWAIISSVASVLLESVVAIEIKFGNLLRILEWAFTILFTIEYFMRCYCVKKPLNYMKSFFGVIDLLAILPTYMSIFFTGAQSLIVIRALRLLRVFRVLKLGRYLGEFEILIEALKSSWDKITVFLSVVITITIITGTLMYLIEGEASGFTSIPKSIYWAIVTLTTVGYGDISPKTTLGQTIASIIMILGYAIIVVPTGIFSVELSKVSGRRNLEKKCSHCDAKNHLANANYCHFCGNKL